VIGRQPPEPLASGCEPLGGGLVGRHPGKTLCAQPFHFLRFGSKHRGALLQHCILLLSRHEPQGLGLTARLFGSYTCRFVHDAVPTPQTPEKDIVAVARDCATGQTAERMEPSLLSHREEETGSNP